MNISLSSLFVSQQSRSPFFGAASRVSLQKSLFCRQISPVFFRLAPITVSGSMFRNFASAVVRINSETKVYSDVYTKGKKIINSSLDIEFRDTAFVSISSQATESAVQIETVQGGPIFSVLLNRTKFYNCSTPTTAAALSVLGCPLAMNCVCVTHACARSKSAFSVSTKDFVCNSSFSRQSVSIDSSSSAMFVQSDRISISNINLTMSNNNSESALGLSFNEAHCSFVSVDQWNSPIAVKFDVLVGTSTVDSFNFNKVEVRDGLVGVSGQININTFTLTEVSMPTAFIDTHTFDTTTQISVANSMFDDTQVNASFVVIDVPKYNRSMTNVPVVVGYGPGCYNTPPPTQSSTNYTPYFIGFAGLLLVIVVGGIAYSVIFLIKKPRAFEESTQMQNYEIMDKYGESRITA